MREPRNCQVLKDAAERASGAEPAVPTGNTERTDAQQLNPELQKLEHASDRNDKARSEMVERDGSRTDTTERPASNARPEAEMTDAAQERIGRLQSVKAEILGRDQEPDGPTRPTGRGGRGV